MHRKPNCWIHSGPDDSGMVIVGRKLPWYLVLVTFRRVSYYAAQVTR